VFDLVSDHARYQDLSSVSRSRLVRRGTEDENGVGARREIRASGLRFEEEITAYDRPSSFSYKIVSSTLPIEHEGGTVDFSTVDGATKVVWVSTFRLKLPIFSRLATADAARRLERAFAEMLSEWRQRLERAV
jgi:hypothetical protein